MHRCSYAFGLIDRYYLSSLAVSDSSFKICSSTCIPSEMLLIQVLCHLSFGVAEILSWTADSERARAGRGLLTMYFAHSSDDNYLIMTTDLLFFILARPRLCTYPMMVKSLSKRTTRSQDRNPSPSSATLVATRMLKLPLRNSATMRS